MAEDFEEPTEDDPLYGLWQAGWRPMNHAPINEEVEAHIERCFGKTETVLHEHLSLHVHLDVNVIPPSHGRRFTTYVTSGMSDLPMQVPPDVDAGKWSRAELVVALPGPPEGHSGHYLISAMRDLARYPHVCGTWLCYPHTVQEEGGDPIGDDTKLNAKILGCPIATPIVDDSDAYELNLRDGGFVHFLAMIPIYQEELDLKIAKGTDELFKLFDDIELTELYLPDRRNAVLDARRKQRGFLQGLFRRKDPLRA